MKHKPRILIVDDEPLNVKLLSAILSSDRYEIIKAFNGEQALKKVYDESPDIIILDIMMPDIDGFEITRKLKNEHTTRDIPIILITASNAADYKVIGQEAGADEFLNKPIKSLELKSRVKSLIHTKNYLDELALLRQNDSDNPSFSRKIFFEENERKSVLLVSDDEDNAKLVKMFLKGQTYKVVNTKTTQEAIELSDKNQVDLILLDVMQNAEESLETYYQLKEKEQTANIQILVISDSAYLEKNNEHFELWADDFLIKPINVHEIRLRVKALLTKKTYLDKLSAGAKDGVKTAITDGLSGLANYAYFKFFFEHEIKRSLRDNQSVALLMFDLTGKNQNEFGTGSTAAIGEKLLKKVGMLIREKIRDIDLGARLKESKFAIVLANTNQNGAEIVAERLQGLIQRQLSPDIDTELEQERLHFGIAVYPSDGETMDRLISEAEKDMHV